VRRPGAGRRLLWLAVAVGVVVLLVRRHVISSAELIIFCTLIPSLVLHEVSHGLVALACGDDTAKRAGRLTLNPLAHVDPIGTVVLPALMVFTGLGFFGWAKPVPVNVSRLRSPRNQGVLVSLAGPATNIVLAAVAGVLFVVLHGNTAGSGPTITLWAEVLFYAGLVNLWIAVFNLLPIPPLDGSVLLERLIPAAWWPEYLRLRRYALPVFAGTLILLATVRVYPTAPIFSALGNWWASVLHLRLVG
jgi:Zn-dependent protease